MSEENEANGEHRISRSAEEAAKGKRRKARRIRHHPIIVKVKWTNERTIGRIGEGSIQNRTEAKDDGRLEGRLNSDGIRPKKAKGGGGGGAEPLDEEGPKGTLNDGIRPKGGQKPKGGGAELLDDDGPKKPWPKNGRNLNGLNFCSSLPDSSELLSSDAISDELFGASLCPLTKMAIVKRKAAIKNLLAIICDN
ncbi:hypothetical protein niasHT_024342 [Heterodera trifolii]|uniref:Uncharacterized protein n=1 Tax=Heterodera trifolii TaxID=157864 RepID=A0ABD2JMA2_9BILA